MSKLKVTTIANVADSESTDVTNVINGSAKAWVNFNGTGTVAIRQSFNVSSITDNGAGDYTVNFTNAMPDANYSPTIAHGNANGRIIYIHHSPYPNDTTGGTPSLTTTTARFRSYDLSSVDSPNDTCIVSIAIFR